jgi:hypothetical protein
MLNEFWIEEGGGGMTDTILADMQLLSAMLCHERRDP